MAPVPEGRAANRPFFETTLIPPMAPPLPGAWSRPAVIASPASSRAGTPAGVSAASCAPCAAVAGASTRSATDSPSEWASGRVGEWASFAHTWAGRRPQRVVISAASSADTRPSLLEVQAVPSRRRKLAPSLSSPPKPGEPSSRPAENYLKLAGTLSSLRPRRAAMRLIVPVSLPLENAVHR